MNKVLIICSNFLPVKNGGTIRCDKLVKYLPYFDWKSVVLTKRSKNTTNFDIIDTTPVYRTRKFDVASSLLKITNKLSSFLVKKKNRNKLSIESTKKTNTTVKRRVSDYFLLPDSDVFWALGAVFKSFKIFIKEKPSVVLSTGPSHSVHIVGYCLKKMYHTKWVVEFRDPWTMNPFRIEKPFKFLASLDNYLEKIVLKNADVINVTSIEYKIQFLEKYTFLDSNKIVNIPNGFDPEDLEVEVRKKNEVLTIVHSGNFYQHRSSVQCITAIIYLLENNLLQADEVLIKFIGILDQEGIQLINNSKFKKCFLLLGYISHQESIKEIKSADLLLLIPGPGIGTMPGKFYEYLAAEKPIFCISNEGPPKKYINDFILGSVSRDFDAIEIANDLNRLIKSIKGKEFVYPNVSELKDRFNRKFIAKDMAKIFTK